MLAKITPHGDVVPINHVPHRASFRAWRKRLPQKDYEAVRERLNEIAADAADHNTPITSSWIPGRDWRGTPFQPLYEKACRCDPDAAALFFGLLLWEVMLERPEWWSFGRYRDSRGIPIEGLTYFRIEP